MGRRGFDKIKNGFLMFANLFASATIAQNFANISLFFIYAGMFFYQSAVGMRLIEPVIFGGWGVLMVTLFPCLSLLFLVKLIYVSRSISKLECVFFSFLIVVLTFVLKGTNP